MMQVSVGLFPLTHAGEGRGEAVSAANAFDVDLERQRQLAANSSPHLPAAASNAGKGEKALRLEVSS
jgi:hypothetical protein